MTADEQLRWRRAKEIFDAACDESAAEQVEIVEGMAAGDAALAADVGRLLAMQAQSSLTLDAPVNPCTLGLCALRRFSS